MARFLQQSGTGRIYVATEELSQRSDMRPVAGNPFAPKDSRPVAPAPKLAAPVEDDSDDDDELEAARAHYEDVFGKAPNPRMKIDTLRMRIAEEVAAQADADVRNALLPEDEDEDEDEDSPGPGFNEE